jgi:hypothetical protein
LKEVDTPPGHAAWSGALPALTTPISNRATLKTGFLIFDLFWLCFTEIRTSIYIIRYRDQGTRGDNPTGKRFRECEAVPPERFDGSPAGGKQAAPAGGKQER